VKAREENGFDERTTAASRAKKAQIEKFRASLTAPDPAKVERQAARAALVADRQRRADEREAERQAAADKLAAERQAASDKLAAEQAAAAAEAALQAEREAEAKLEADAANHAEFLDKQERALALKAEQKSKRDARYAARKARG
jgi:hypothetical protein